MLFSKLRGLKPSSLAMRTSCADSPQRRAASAQVWSIAALPAINSLEMELKAKTSRPYREREQECGAAALLPDCFSH
jgi:hypothetical protein